MDFVVAELRQQMDFARLADGLLLNTSMEIEPKFLRHLEVLSLEAEAIAVSHCGLLDRQLIFRDNLGSTITVKAYSYEDSLPTMKVKTKRVL